ncbi:SixA phosphatase family protein [Nocardioides pacificus]
MPANRRLVLMRHAQAESHADSDAARDLTAGGRKDAAQAAAWLTEQGFAPDHALVSAATRTRSTWTELVAGTGWTIDPDVDRGLYSAGPETALDLVRLAPATARSLIVVGHNPTIAYLAQLLDDGEGDQQAGAAMAAGYPTAALATFEYDGEWGDLAFGSARLVAFHVGRG